MLQYMKQVNSVIQNDKSILQLCKTGDDFTAGCSKTAVYINS
jgi:hypothetical protein